MKNINKKFKILIKQNIITTIKILYSLIKNIKHFNPRKSLNHSQVRSTSKKLKPWSSILIFTWKLKYIKNVIKFIK